MHSKLSFSFVFLILLPLLVACPSYPPPVDLSFPDDPRILHGAWIADATESTDYLGDLQVSPSGDQVFLRGSYGLRRFDTTTWLELPFIAESINFEEVTYAPDETLITTERAYPTLIISFWNPDDGSLLEQRDVVMPQQSWYYALTPEALFFTEPLDTNRTLVTRYDFQAGSTRRFELPERSGNVWADRDGSGLIALDMPRSVRLYSATTGDPIAFFRFRDATVFFGDISPDSRWFAYLEGDGQLNVYNLHTMQRVTAFDSYKQVGRVAFSADSQQLITSSYQGEVSVFELDGRRVATVTVDAPNTGAPQAALFPDGTRLVTSGWAEPYTSTSQAIVWNVATGAAFTTLPDVHPYQLHLGLTASYDEEHRYTVEGVATLNGTSYTVTGTVWNHHLHRYLAPQHGPPPSMHQRLELHDSNGELRYEIVTMTWDAHATEFDGTIHDAETRFTQIVRLSRP